MVFTKERVVTGQEVGKVKNVLVVTLSNLNLGICTVGGTSI